MYKKFFIIGIIVIVIGFIGFIAGAAFVGEGFAKQIYLVDSMRQENIKLSDLGITGPDADKIIDNAKYAQIVADKVRQDRHQIAPSYNALLGGKHFDPTNPQQLSYAQALNLENYLYLAVASFGIVDIALGAGAFMIITGVALILIGILLLKFPRKMPQEAS
jgi:hypothetical protein